MSEIATLPGPTLYESLFGGAELPIIEVDHVARKATETRVFVRQIPVGEYPKAFAAAGDEFALVDLYCLKPSGWSKNLAPQSFTQLVAEGGRLNQDFLSYCGRTMQAELDAARRLSPELVAKVLETVQSRSPRLSRNSHDRPV